MCRVLAGCIESESEKVRKISGGESTQVCSGRRSVSKRMQRLLFAASVRALGSLACRTSLYLFLWSSFLCLRCNLRVHAEESKKERVWGKGRGGYGRRVRCDAW